MNTIPRIRGVVGQYNDGPEKDKWCFQISIWDLGGEHQVGEPITVGPWETEEQAHKEMRKACEMCCDEAEKLATGKSGSGRYLDMKNGGVMRNWKEN